MTIPRFSIRNILIGTSFAIFLYLLLLAGGIFYGNSRISTQISQIIEFYDSIEDFNELESLPVQIRRHEKDYFLNMGVNKENQEKCVKLWTSKIERMEKNITAAKECMLKINCPNAEKQAQALLTRLHFYRDGFLKVKDSIEQGEITTPQDANIAINSYKDSIYQVTKLSGEFVKVYKQHINKMYQDVSLITTIVSRVIIILSILSLLFTFFFIAFLFYNITRPIRHFTSRIRDLAEGEGDLTVSMQTRTVVCSDYINCGITDCPAYGKETNNCAQVAGSLAYRTGGEAFCPPLASGKIKNCDQCIVTARLAGHEMDELAYNVDKFISRIRAVVSDVITIADRLSDSMAVLSGNITEFSDNAQNQAAAAEEVTATMEEISAGVDNVNDNAQYQYDNLEQMIKLFGQLSELITTMGRDITTTRELSGNISGQAEAGNESLKLMNNSMASINESSSQVTNIINIINDISDQINLLSLNASIEAARAGEQGRGFAVVADEISKLADETANSLKEIGTLINKNEDEIAAGMNNVNTTIENISMIVYGIEAIGEKIDGIFNNMQTQQDNNTKVNNSVEDVRVKSDEVKKATQEQKVAVNDVMQSISSINELNQKSAAGAEEMSASSKEISDLAVKLKNRVDYFKV